MLTLLRRHGILSVATLLAILLVLVGWWLRPDMNAAPANEPTEDAAVVQPHSHYRAVDAKRDASDSGFVEDDGPVGCSGVFVEMQSRPTFCYNIIRKCSRCQVLSGIPDRFLSEVAGSGRVWT